MKISSVSNDQITIQANVNKIGDYAAVLLVAKEMCKTAGLAMAAACEYEQWIMLTDTWSNSQAQEFKDAYGQAKKNLKNGASK